MLTVVVDCATPAITSALVEITADAVTVLAERVSVDSRAHGELLAPQLDAVLREAGVAPGKIGAVVAGLGPGPFTGLRVGLVTAAALGDALGIPCYGVCTLDALGLAAAGAGADGARADGARADGTPAGAGAGDVPEPGRVPEPGGVPAPEPGGALLVATDARRKEIYWAVYAGTTRIAGPDVSRPAELALPPGVRSAVGDGALRYAEILAGYGLSVREQPRYPGAAALATLAADRIRAGAPGERLTPLYLRRPDAVAPGERKPVTP